MAIEKFAFGSDTHGVQSQKDILQHFSRIELTFSFIKLPVFFFQERIKIEQYRIISSIQILQSGLIGNVPFLIQFLQHNLYDIHFPLGKFFVGTEKILQEADMLGKPGPDPECLRRIRVFRSAGIIPELRFQRIDDILPTHQIDIAAAKIPGQIHILHFRIQVAASHAGFPHINQQ